MAIGKISRAVLLLCCYLSFLALFTGSAGVTFWRSEAMRAEQATLYTAAIRAYLIAANWHPADPLLYRRVGEIYLLQGRLSLAQNALWHAYLLDIQSADTLAALGNLDAARGDVAAAVSWYEQACTRGPARAEFYLALGKAQLNAGDSAAALAAFQRALATDAEQAEAHYFLGLLLAAEDGQKAREHLSRAARADSPLQFQAQEMLADLSSSILIQDANERAGELGLAYIRQRAWRLAANQLARLVESVPDHAETQAYWGYALYQIGDYAAAEQVLQKALQLDQNNAQIYHFLGILYLARGWTYSSVEALGRAYELDSANPAIAADIAQAYVNAGAYEEAESWYEEVAELAPQDGRYALLQASFHIDRAYHVSDRGLPAAERALVLSPGEAVAHDLYGWGLFLAGDAARARTPLEDALSLNPQRATTHYHLAQVYARLGDRRLARVHYGRVIDLDTSNTLRPYAERALQRLGAIK